MHDTLVLTGIADLLVLYYLVRIAKRLMRSRKWLSAEGRIVRSEVVRETFQTGDGLADGDVPKIEYEFEGEGGKYRGTRIALDSSTGGVWSPSDIVRKYPIGKSVRVFYDPADPRDTALDRNGEPLVQAVVLLSLLLVLLTTLGVLKAMGIL